MSETVTAWIGYGLAWFAFGALHSLTAGTRFKEKFGTVFGGAYRLSYNVFALVSIGCVIWAGLSLFEDTPAFDLPRGLKMFLGAMQIAGWFLLFLAFRPYDTGLFLGIAQMRQGSRSIDGDEPLQTGGFNRYVRHPLYSAVFLILWGAVWTPFGLATAIFGSVYLLIGTWFEERKLLAMYGDDYAAYRTRVPAFIPWRGRAWPAS